MNKFVIFTDAGGDFLEEQRVKYNLERQPKSTIVWPDKSEREADIDWKEIAPNDFYALLDNKKNNFSSSVPAPGVVKERLTEYAKKGLDVLCITISSTMSGGYSLYCTVAKEVMEENPGSTIIVIDSLRYGPAISLLAIEASLYRGQGHNLQQTADYINEMKLHVHQCGVLDDLFFLARKGRISSGKAFMGNLIGVKPMADLCNETGLSQVIGKARGYQKFYKVFPNYIRNTIGTVTGKVFVVSYSLREPQAKQLVDIIKSEFAPEHLILLPLGQTSGVNVGPGLAAAFYIGDERVSPNCQKEQAILEELLLKK